MSHKTFSESYIKHENLIIDLIEHSLLFISDPAIKYQLESDDALWKKSEDLSSFLDEVYASLANLRQTIISEGINL